VHASQRIHSTPLNRESNSEKILGAGLKNLFIIAYYDLSYCCIVNFEVIRYFLKIENSLMSMVFFKKMKGSIS
jgi:hypothetical protein